MRKWMLVLVVGVMIGLLSACCPLKGRHMTGCGSCCCKTGMTQGQPCCLKPGGQSMAPAAATTARADVVYACACGEGCRCNALSKQPGNCGCGKPLAWHHVIKVEGDEALLCGCAEGCSCKLDPSDPGKCGCGKPVKRVSLKDSGLFFCNCGGSCSCNTVKAEAGPCSCGMALKQVN